MKNEAPMALTVVQVKNAKPKEKLYKFADERGLYLLVNPNGSKFWKLKYRFAGIERKLSLKDKSGYKYAGEVTEILS